MSSAHLVVLVSIPGFLVRKLYKRGSLRETADGRFAFTLHNPLGSATIIAPPTFTINGIRHQPTAVHAPGVEIAHISAERPFTFSKGAHLDVSFDGRLLRGANRIHMVASTKEFGDLELFVEDAEADYCDLPGMGEEE